MRKPPKAHRKEVCIPEAKISRPYASCDPKPRCPHECGHGTLGACATSVRGDSDSLRHRLFRDGPLTARTAVERYGAGRGEETKTPFASAWPRGGSRRYNKSRHRMRRLRARSGFRREKPIWPQHRRSVRSQCARVAKLADAKDLKSFLPQGECGFKSRPGHQITSPYPPPSISRYTRPK